MKMLIGLLALTLSFVASATIDMKTFTYDGSQNSMMLNLSTEKTHTEYRVEQHRSTCYRTEIVGYRTVCTGGGGRGRGRGGRYCHQQPIYRTVAYSCMETVRIPYEVKDYDVNAQVLIDVTNLGSMATSGETFKVTLDGDTLSLMAMGSKKFFIMLKKEDIQARMRGSVKMLDGLYAIELIEAKPVLKALKMTNISLEDSMLNFKMGPLENKLNVGFSLNVTQKRALSSDIVLFDRELNTLEVNVSATSEGSDAAVDVKKLGVELSSGKYSLTAKAFFKAEGTLLNKKDFSENLETSRTLIYKIR